MSLISSKVLRKPFSCVSRAKSKYSIDASISFLSRIPARPVNGPDGVNETLASAIVMISTSDIPALSLIVQVPRWLVKCALHRLNRIEGFFEGRRTPESGLRPASGATRRSTACDLVRTACLARDLSLTPLEPPAAVLVGSVQGSQQAHEGSLAYTHVVAMRLLTQWSGTCHYLTPALSRSTKSARARPRSMDAVDRRPSKLRCVRALSSAGRTLAGMWYKMICLFNVGYSSRAHSRLE
ncbi:hypothetical protein B0H11DRAFT_2289209 [Mycena galericulata]|nr:hypothetical protein B0H11DRAFT_2289209 [Mycena galericulata]